MAKERGEKHARYHQFHISYPSILVQCTLDTSNLDISKTLIIFFLTLRISLMLISVIM